MSDTWNLVSHESRKKIWVGQGNGNMSTFYSGEPETMEHLKRFLNDTKGESLELVSDMMEEKHHNYEDYPERRVKKVGMWCKTKLSTWCVSRVRRLVTSSFSKGFKK